MALGCRLLRWNLTPADRVEPARRDDGRDSGLSRRSAWAFAKAGERSAGRYVALIGEHLKKGARIRIAGLGTVEVRKRSARMGRNPATGEAIEIKASKKVAFRAAKDLSEAV